MGMVRIQHSDRVMILSLTSSRVGKAYMDATPPLRMREFPVNITGK